MSTSAMNDLKCSDKDWQKILQKPKELNRICRKALKKHHKQWHSDWHNGYAAYLGGHRMDDREIKRRENYETEYIAGYRNAKHEVG